MRAINLSRILSCVSMLGVIGTAACSAVETPEAMKKLAEAKEENLDLVHTALKVAPSYKKTIAVGTLTICTTFGSSHVLMRNVKNVNNAYKQLAKSYDQYKAAAVATLGVAGEAALNDKVARDNGKDLKYEISSFCGEIGEFTGLELGPKLWWYEPISQTYFQESAFNVMGAFCGVEQTIADNFFVSVNKFLDLLGFPRECMVPGGDVLGWAQDVMLTEYECLYVPFHFEKMGYDVNHPDCRRIVYEMNPEICYEGLN